MTQPEAVSSPAQATTKSKAKKPAKQSAPKHIAVIPAGSCSSELSKYDWNVSDAYKIMMQESGNNPLTINDNPRTGDYSVGCFQINLIGNMRHTRPPEAWLLNPKNNVKYAYEMYAAQGRTFCKTSGWYNSCIKAGIR